MNKKPKPKSERYRGLREFLNEFRRSKSGLIGLIMIFAFVAISVYSTVEFPYSKAQEWNDRRYWTNNPTNVPPAWIQYVTNRALPETMVYTAPNSTKLKTTYNGTISIFTAFDQSLSFRYTFDDTPPT